MRLVNGLVFGASVATAVVATSHVSAQQAPAPDLLAAQVRLQGHPCDAPVSAQRESAPSRPDEAVWVLKCANGSYRMRLTPDMAAQVEKID